MISAFVFANWSRSSLFVTATMMADCLPMPLAAYSPASTICAKSSLAGIVGWNLRMLLRSSIALIISFIVRFSLLVYYFQMRMQEIVLFFFVLFLI